MEQYLKERSMLFNAWSTFSCPDSCERMGCKVPNLHVFISLVDLVAISLISVVRHQSFSRRMLKLGSIPLKKTNPGSAGYRWSWTSLAIFSMEKCVLFIRGDRLPVPSFQNIASWVNIQKEFFKKRYSKTFHVSRTPVLSPREEGQHFNSFWKCLGKRSPSRISFYLASHLLPSISRILLERD